MLDLTNLRVITAMVTPFDSKRNLDIEETSNLAEHLESTGSEGIVIAGTTGESPTLTLEETKILFETVKAATNIPIIYGAGSNCTKTMLKNIKQAEQLGADGLLLVSPYYNRPPQKALYTYFETASKATSLPIIVYDIPVRTGRGIDFETLQNILELPNVIGLKDAAGDPERCKKLLTNIDTCVWSGDDDLNYSFMKAGAVGAISVASHWHGNKMLQMFTLGSSSLYAKDLHKEILQVTTLSTNERPNPISTKMILNHIGIRVGGCRPPLNVVEPFNLKEKRVLEQLRKDIN